MTPAPRVNYPLTDPGPNFDSVEIRRSRRRRATIAGRIEDRVAIIMVPASLSRSEEQRAVESMLAKLRGKRRRAALSDPELAQRADRLNQTYLAGRARPDSVRWVGDLRTRWGSATPATRSIRLSSALQRVPQYVVDYVLVHELAHLVVPGGHTPEFWEAVAAYPRTQRAQGYLEAYSQWRGSVPAGASDGGMDPGNGLASPGTPGLEQPEPDDCTDAFE